MHSTPNDFKLDQNMFASTWKISLKKLRAQKQLPRRQLEKIIQTGKDCLNKDYEKSKDDPQKPEVEEESKS